MAEAIQRGSWRRSLFLLTGALLLSTRLALCQEAAWAASPRIDSVEMVRPQPIENDPALIWYDDFNGPPRKYSESSGGLDGTENFGGPGGKSMRCLYEKGKRGVGNRKVFFGDSPIGAIARKGEKFDEIYWRIYDKHQAGWTGGGPDKMSRATSIVSSKWNQAMISHVWGHSEMLTLDPASGVKGGRVVTTQYNDFPNLHWLGNKPSSRFKIHGTDESGTWVCVEARAKLNTPGQKDGENQLWIDGVLECERRNLDWRDGYAGHGINAVFLEAYWNNGSPVTQSRWYDNFVISARPIGPVVAPRNPMLFKARREGAGPVEEWEVEIAVDRREDAVVWKSKPVRGEEQVRVGETSGQFVGTLSRQKALAADGMYVARARQKSTDGEWSDWSPWHQAFRTTK